MVVSDVSVARMSGAEAIGLPHFGQEAARFDTSFPHSTHLTSATSLPPVEPGPATVLVDGSASLRPGRERRPTVRAASSMTASDAASSPTPVSFKGLSMRAPAVVQVNLGGAAPRLEPLQSFRWANRTPASRSSLPPGAARLSPVAWPPLPRFGGTPGDPRVDRRPVRLPLGNDATAPRQRRCRPQVRQRRQRMARWHRSSGGEYAPGRRSAASCRVAEASG